MSTILYGGLLPMRTIYVSAEVKIYVETEMEVDGNLSDGEITDENVDKKMNEILDTV